MMLVNSSSSENLLSIAVHPRSDGPCFFKDPKYCRLNLRFSLEVLWLEVNGYFSEEPTGDLATSSTDTGFAVSAAKSVRVSGPRESATATSCPRAVNRRARLPPICPLPIMPFSYFINSSEAAPQTGEV